MHSTLLWYLDDNPQNERLFGKTADGVSVEYVKQDGKLYACRLISSDPRSYLDSRFTPGRSIDLAPEKLQ